MQQTSKFCLVGHGLWIVWRGDNAEEIISHTAEHYTALGLHFHNAKCNCIVQLYDTQCTMSKVECILHSGVVSEDTKQPTQSRTSDI